MATPGVTLTPEKAKKIVKRVMDAVRARNPTGFAGILIGAIEAEVEQTIDMEIDVFLPDLQAILDAV